MRKTKIGLVLCLLVSAFPAAGQDRDDYGPRLPWERVEIALTAGYGLSLADWTSLHLVQTATPAGFRTSARNRLQMSTRGAPAGGASVAFYFRSGLILQGGFGYFQADVSNDAFFEFQYSRPPAVSRFETFPGKGRLTTVPVFLNAVNTFGFLRRADGKFKGTLSLGPALFFNAIVVDAFGGAAGWLPAGPGGVPDERADAFRVPVVVEDKTWISLGGDIGLALDYQFSRPLALTVEGRFFYAPKKNLAWKWEPGPATGLTGEIPAYDFTPAMADVYIQNTTPITLQPSYFHFAAGLKLVF
ncbi:MAG: hypothetical protein FJY82_06700 [Candidatus Aminicenantes bacterium]|nr:hypothetical protein [Candidatus Aminicenantes bacterium]